MRRHHDARQPAGARAPPRARGRPLARPRSPPRGRFRRAGAASHCALHPTARLQIRGVRLEDADAVVEGLIARGMGSFQAGMDSVRNLTGSPIAGIDPHELLDVRLGEGGLGAGVGAACVCCVLVCVCVCMLS
jgi:hypothetical protein